MDIFAINNRNSALIWNIYHTLFTYYELDYLTDKNFQGDQVKDLINLWLKTRLISIESQPKKIVVVVVIGAVVVVVVGVIPGVDPKNIPLKFG